MATERGCSIDGCDQKHYGLGWCQMHYTRWRRHGDPSAHAKVIRNDVCTIEGCGSVHYGGGWCNKHYQRWLRRGDPLAVSKPHRGGRCQVNGCEGSNYGQGWCKLHYDRWRRHGDPLLGGRTKYAPLCSIEGCKRPSRSLGWCKMHYQRWLANGTTTLIPSNPRQAAQKCGCCKHPEVDHIEASLRSGASDAEVSRRFGLSRDTVGTHRRKHMDNLEMATAVASAAAARLTAARRRAQDAGPSLTTTP